MKLSEYYEMIAKIDGTSQANPDPRLTRKDLEFNGGKGKDGSATITFLDGKPIYLGWWIWDLDHAWMIEQIEKELGGKIILSNWEGGNGHNGADLELI